MIIKHQDKTPIIDPSAYVAPNALICGEVSVGKNVRIMFGAQIIAENAPIVIGDGCIILENAVLRGTHDFPLNIGNHCLIGPCAHLVGCTIHDHVFVATGAAIFHGAILERGSEVRINGVVHLKTVLPENATVPIGWVAVGNPAQVLPPDRHEEIWAIQKPLNFPLSVYGIDRPRPGEESAMPLICSEMSLRLASHLNDEIIES